MRTSRGPVVGSDRGMFSREPEDESIPLLDWLRERPVKVQAKCTERTDWLGDRLGDRATNSGDRKFS